MSDRSRRNDPLASASGSSGWLRERPVETLSQEETREVVEKLRLQQTELESQNEELRQLQEALQASQEALLASEERYRDLYELAPMAYLTLTVDGVITGANLSAARVLLIPRDRLVGCKFSDFVTPPYQDRWYLSRRSIVSGEVFECVCELDLTRPDGRVLRAELALAREEGEGGEACEIRVALLDVSSRRRLEKARRMAAAREVLADQDDRRKLAEQLHAGIEQSLALAGMKLGALRDAHDLSEIREIDESIRNLSRQVADFSQQLFPTALADLGIMAAAQWLTEEVERRSGATIHPPAGPEIEDVDFLIRIVLFRTLREILESVSARAETGTCRVRLDPADGESLVLEIESPGVELEVDEEPDRLELLHTRDRLEQFGGRLHVRSRPEAGTRILATLPRRLGDEPDRMTLS